eukprot:scaffold544_cov320-Pavlova_lutheri.AAC.89
MAATAGRRRGAEVRGHPKRQDHAKHEVVRGMALQELSRRLTDRKDNVLTGRVAMHTAGSWVSKEYSLANFPTCRRNTSSDWSWIEATSP